MCPNALPVRVLAGSKHLLPEFDFNSDYEAESEDEPMPPEREARAYPAKEMVGFSNGWSMGTVAKRRTARASPHRRERQRRKGRRVGGRRA